MLRKRTSFKPNLSQVAAPKPNPPSQPAPPPAGGSSDAAAAAQGSIGQAAPASQRPPSPTKTSTPSVHNETGDKDAPRQDTNVPAERENVAGDQVDAALVVRPTVNITKELNEESSRRVHDAINQLTGQKFEPIKTISLRNSANKNVKLKDLLFFNPPLTKDQKRHRKNLHLAKKNERKRLAEEQDKSKETTDSISSKDDANSTNNPTSNPEPPVEMDTDEPALVPKVKLGPDGKLVLDESSTIINRKNVIKAQEAIIEDNEEIISRTNYDSYRRKPTSTSQTKWSIDDTQKFYQALTIFGTDFSMMESLLFEGHRSRTELHKKFKREERLNKAKIDIALTNRISLDSEELDELRDVFYKT